MSRCIVNKDTKVIVEAVLEEEGITSFIYAMRRNGHSSVVYRLPSGRSRFYVFASTASDYRANSNLKCGLRRTIRADKQEDLAIARDLQRA